MSKLRMRKSAHPDCSSEFGRSCKTNNKTIHKEENDDKNRLLEMSIEELWQLFPIYLTEHSECWAAWFAEEEAGLRKLFTDSGSVRLSHIGSTAVPGIWAKPIIDILAEAPVGSDLKALKQVLTRGGYICMSENEQRLSFNRGYTADGFAERVFHLHLRFEGDNDELYFRDLLINEQKTAREYEALKIRLWKRFEHDRDAYTAAKTEFVTECTQRAKEEYKDKYKAVRI